MPRQLLRTQVRNVFVFAALFLSLAQVAKALPAEENEAPPAAAASQTDTSSGHRSRLFWLPMDLHLRGGLALSSQDPDVRGTWSHETGRSYLVAAALLAETGRIFSGDVWFYAGPEFAYQQNNEQISSGQASAYLSSQISTFLIDFGVSWQPRFLNRKFGTQVYLGLPLWSQKSASLDSEGFTRDLGTHQDLTFASGINFFYDYRHILRPFIGIESREAILITLGTNYVF